MPKPKDIDASSNRCRASVAELCEGLLAREAELAASFVLPQISPGKDQSKDSSIAQLAGGDVHSGDAEALHLLVALALAISAAVPDAQVAVSARESVLASLRLLDVLARPAASVRVVQGADAGYVLGQLEIREARVVGAQARGLRARVAEHGGDLRAQHGARPALGKARTLR